MSEVMYKELIEELESFKEDLERRLMINVKFDADELMNHLEENEIKDIDELVSAEISEILELKISKIDVWDGEIYLFIRNAFGSGSDGKFNRIVVFDRHGEIVNVLNGYDEKIERLDVYDLIQLYAVYVEYGNSERLKELCEDAIDEMFE